MTNYPLHPGQTVPEPYYVTIPMEEYEAMKKRIKELETENNQLKLDRELKGIIDNANQDC